VQANYEAIFALRGRLPGWVTSKVIVHYLSRSLPGARFSGVCRRVVSFAGSERIRR
jgi:hypothetical protein